jgi:primosomal protein N' (replication factor Y)
VLADVIVDLQVWGLDRSLTYTVPEALAGQIRVGSIVRVPLRNRRVRGWVVGVQTEGEPPEGSQPIAALSGRGPVFDQPLLRVAGRLARRYIQPLSSFLGLFTPARLGRPAKKGFDPVPLPAGGSASRTLLRLACGEDPFDHYVTGIASALEQGRGAIIAVPEVREGSRMLGRLAEAFPDQAAVVHSGVDPAERSTALWQVASGKRKLVLGGRASVFAPPFALGLIVLHQEHDSGFKEQRAPYYDAREVALLRAGETGASLVAASATPSLRVPEDLMGWSSVSPDRGVERASWPAVEVVNASRRIPERAVGALVQARRRSERAIFLLPRVSRTTGGPGPDELVAYLSRVVPEARITRADRPSLGSKPGQLAEALTGDVVVATEAALADTSFPDFSVAVALGADALLQRPAGRAAEEAVQTLWGLAALVANRQPRGRLIVETRHPDHHVVQALLRGDYRLFASRELEERQAGGAPPFKTLLRVICPVMPPQELVGKLSDLPGTSVLGPAPGGALGWQLLLKVDQLEAMVDPLRDIVSTAPERLLVELQPRDW